MQRACRSRRCTRIPTLPGDGEYDRGERQQFVRDLRMWFAGCGIVVLIVLVAFAIYAVLLVHSGWPHHR